MRQSINVLKKKCGKKSKANSKEFTWPRLQSSEQNNKLMMVLDESPQGPINTPEATLT